MQGCGCKELFTINSTREPKALQDRYYHTVAATYGTVWSCSLSQRMAINHRSVFSSDEAPTAEWARRSWRVCAPIVRPICFARLFAVSRMVPATVRPLAGRFHGKAFCANTRMLRNSFQSTHRCILASVYLFRVYARRAFWTVQVRMTVSACISSSRARIEITCRAAAASRSCSLQLPWTEKLRRAQEREALPAHHGRGLFLTSRKPAQLCRWCAVYAINAWNMSGWPRLRLHKSG